MRHPGEFVIPAQAGIQVFQQAVPRFVAPGGARRTTGNCWPVRQHLSLRARPAIHAGRGRTHAWSPAAWRDEARHGLLEVLDPGFRRDDKFQGFNALGPRLRGDDGIATNAHRT
jgi:hypothetical protein